MPVGRAVHRTLSRLNPTSVSCTISSQSDDILSSWWIKFASKLNACLQSQYYSDEREWCVYQRVVSRQFCQCRNVSRGCFDEQEQRSKVSYTVGAVWRGLLALLFITKFLSKTLMNRPHAISHGWFRDGWVLWEIRGRKAAVESVQLLGAWLEWKNQHVPMHHTVQGLNKDIRCSKWTETSTSLNRENRCWCKIRFLGCMRVSSVVSASSVCRLYYECLGSWCFQYRLHKAPQVADSVQNLQGRILKDLRV